MFSLAAAILTTTFDGRRISILVGDHVIGREHTDHRIRMLAQQQKCRESNGRRAIPTDRFCQHLCLR